MMQNWTKQITTKIEDGKNFKYIINGYVHVKIYIMLFKIIYGIYCRVAKFHRTWLWNVRWCDRPEHLPKDY